MNRLNNLFYNSDHILIMISMIKYLLKKLTFCKFSLINNRNIKISK